MTVNTNEKTHAVYIIHTKPCLDRGLCVYKIGRTCQVFLKRYETYPHGSQLHIQFRVRNSFDVEKQVIRIFKECFIHRTDFGREYFEGDINELTDKMYNIVQAEPNPEPIIQPDQSICETICDNKPKRFIDRTCSRCHKICATKASLQTHLNRKTQCEVLNINNATVTLAKKFKCDRCDCMFQTFQNLTLHRNRKNPCLVKGEIKSEIVLTAFEQLSQEVQRQKLVIEQLQLMN